jgi:hypothetical protein
LRNCGTLRATLNGEPLQFMNARRGVGRGRSPPSRPFGSYQVKNPMSQVRDFGTVDLKSGRYMLPVDRKTGIFEKVRRGINFV